MKTDRIFRPDADTQLRTAAYEVLNAFVMNSANDSLTMVANLSDEILKRLGATIGMQQQVVSVEDRIALEEMQTSLVSVLLVSYPLHYLYSYSDGVVGNHPTS
jgi:importin subunit beta-1